MVLGQEGRRALPGNAGIAGRSPGETCLCLPGPLPPPIGDVREVAQMSPWFLAGVSGSGPACLPVLASSALGRTPSALEPGLRYPPLGPVPRECLIHNPARSRKPSPVTLTSLHR